MDRDTLDAIETLADACAAEGDNSALLELSAYLCRRAGGIGDRMKGEVNGAMMQERRAERDMGRMRRLIADSE